MIVLAAAIYFIWPILGMPVLLNSETKKRFVCHCEEVVMTDEAIS